MIQGIRFFQQRFLSYIRIYQASLIGLAFFLSSCHSTLSPHHTSSALHSSERSKQHAENNAYDTLGARQHPRILKIYGGAYKNPKLEKMLAKIVHKLTSASKNFHQTYYVTTLDSESVNAFALPGGYIYVTRGMLALANDSSEVAAVLAHEIAHIIANHGILRLQKKAELKLKNRNDTNILSPSSTNYQDTIKNEKQLAQFSRNQELQADSIAIELLNRAGYDPFASPRFLQSLEAYNAFCNSSSDTNTSLDFLATHPTTPERIHLAIKKALKISKPNTGMRDRDGFLNSIDGTIFGGSSDKGYIRENQFIHPKLGISFSFPNGFKITNSSDAVLASNPDKIAIRFDAVPFSSNISVSDYLKSGWISGLDESSVHPIMIQGLYGAHAHAFNEQWQFNVVVILFNNHAFRFLTAAPHNSPNFEAVAKSTVQSFRPLSSLQLSRLKPLRIHVIRIKKAESVANLSNKMQGTAHKEKLFRIINALPPNQTLHAGTRIKIISQ
ncbi:M48 family metalloprotease [Bartonella sp. CB189]|uniref:M48 family metalloprotease n=1 Tax=Bartonella sp. CB189 TaxID=3112254 RepID=UPI002F96D95B